MYNMEDIRFIFFGGEPLAIPVLEALKKNGILPELIVLNPDRPQGRKMILTPPPAKVWALENGIEVFQPESLRGKDAYEKLSAYTADLFIIVAYGKIIPKNILQIPVRGSINLHPSLLPKLRGPSPIRSAILSDMHETGVTVMLMDEEVDHGPIITQETVTIPKSEWPISGQKLDELLATRGAALLADTVPEWIAGTITPHEQLHEEATYTEKITKEMGEIDLSDDPYRNLLKIRAFDGWPGTFFFTERSGRKMRIKITDAELHPDGTLTIKRVVPEGKKEMDYSDFLSGG